MSADTKIIELFRDAIDRLTLDPEIAKKLLQNILEALRGNNGNEQTESEDKGV